MAKRLLSVFVGLIVSFAIIMAFEWLSSTLFTTPHIDPRNPKTISDMMAGMPLAAFIWLLTGYAVSSFSGAAIATLLSGRNSVQPSLIIGGALTVGGIMNLIAIPYHPVWFIAVNVPSYILFALLGYWAGKKKPGPAEKAPEPTN